MGWIQERIRWDARCSLDGWQTRAGSERLSKPEGFHTCLLCWMVLYPFLSFLKIIFDWEILKLKGAFLVAQSVKNPPAVQEMGFDPWVRKIPWRRKWQPTPVFLPGESHGQRSLVGYSPGVTRVGYDLVTKLPPKSKNLVIWNTSYQSFFQCYQPQI